MSFISQIKRAIRLDTKCSPQYGITTVTSKRYIIITAPHHVLETFNVTTIEIRVDEILRVKLERLRFYL